MKKTWYAVRIPSESESQEAIVAYLFAQGSCGCEQQEHFVVGYFEGSRDIDALKRSLENRLGDLSDAGILRSQNKDQVEYQVVPEEDWTSGWKEHFKPLPVTDRMTIAPSWETVDHEVDKLVLRIDPKQAFGTGHHATTRMALRLLEQRISPGDSVLDVGTGTGILGIAAIKLAAANVVALDIDPVAIEAAHENATLNEASRRMKLFVGTLDALRSKAVLFNLVLANINKRELKRMLPALGECLDKGGEAVITGLLQEEREEMLRKIAELRVFKVVESNVQEEWLALVLRRAQA